MNYLRDALSFSYIQDVKSSPEQYLSTYSNSSFNTATHQSLQDNIQSFNSHTQVNSPTSDTNFKQPQLNISQENLQSSHSGYKDLKPLPLQYEDNQDQFTNYLTSQLISQQSFQLINADQIGDNKQSLTLQQDISSNSIKNYFSILKEDSTISQFQYQFRFSQPNIENLTLVQLMQSSIFPKDFDTSLNVLYSVVYTYLLQNKYLEHPFTYLEVLSEIPIFDLTAFFNLAFTNQEIHQLKLRYGFIQLSELISNYLPLQHLFKKFFSKYIEKLQQYPLRDAYFHLMNMQNNHQLPYIPDFHRSRYKEDNSYQQKILVKKTQLNLQNFIHLQIPFSNSYLHTFKLSPHLEQSLSQYQNDNRLEVFSNQCLELTIQVH
ncbi:hypothetical protein ABPG72_016537 [Tetrahymena utriculariae]